VQESGRTVLEEFHRHGLMRKEPIENIIMMPRPNAPFPLRDILEQLGKLDENTAPVEAVVPNDNAEIKYNAFTNNMNAQGEEKRQAMAMNYLMEAEMLDNEASKKREQAYAVAPELRPRKAAPIAATQASVDGEPVLEDVGGAKKRGRKTNAERAAIAANSANNG
jgi:hypothetical protein